MGPDMSRVTVGFPTVSQFLSVLALVWDLDSISTDLAAHGSQQLRPIRGVSIFPFLVRHDSLRLKGRCLQLG